MKSMFVITCFVQVTTKVVFFTKYSVKQDIIRGLTEENTQLRIISPIGYFKFRLVIFYPIGDWGFVLWSCFTRLRNPQSPAGYIIPTIYLISLIGYNMTNLRYFLLVVYCLRQIWDKLWKSRRGRLEKRCWAPKDSLSTQGTKRLFHGWSDWNTSTSRWCSHSLWHRSCLVETVESLDWFSGKKIP